MGYANRDGCIMVKEHISSTEVLTGVRYVWTAVLVVYAHPLCFQ